MKCYLSAHNTLTLYNRSCTLPLSACTQHSYTSKSTICYNVILLRKQAAVPFLIGYNWDEGSLCFPVTRQRTVLRDHLYPSPVRAEGMKAYGDDAAALARLYDPEGGWTQR